MDLRRNEKGQERCLIVAELSGNHSGFFERALLLLTAAKWAGADAVKVQMFKPEQLTLRRQDAAFRVPHGLWKGRTLFDLYQRAATPYEWVPVLKQVAEQLGLLFFTSVYDPETVQIARDLGIDVLKIASYELDYTELLEAVAKSGAAVLMSTGNHDFPAIYRAKETLRPARKRLWLLHCVSAYPTPPDQANLMTLLDLSRYVQGRVGLSDHSPGIAVPIASVGYGARIIEKHLKLDDHCLDAPFSLNAQQFAEMVQGVRAAEAARGQVAYGSPGVVIGKYLDGRWVRTINPKHQTKEHTWRASMESRSLSPAEPEVLDDVSSND